MDHLEKIPVVAPPRAARGLPWVCLAGALLAACSSGSSRVVPEAPAAPPPRGEVPPAVTPPAAEPVASAAPTAPSDELRPVGAPCSQGAQCESGVCEGEGCNPDEARCAPASRGCTRDLRPYCGCDGATFSASGRCPGRPYRHTGPCP